MVKWLKKHPLLVQMAAIVFFFFLSLFLYFLASIREQWAIKQFRANYPEYSVRTVSRRDSPEWVFNLLKKVKLEEYAKRTKQLYISRTTRRSGKETIPIDLQFLPAFTKLTRLHISNSLVSPEPVRNGSKMKELEEIILDYCTISDDGVLIIQNLEKLEHIRSNYLKLKGIKLANLPSLASLDLKNSALGDELFDHLDEVKDTLTSLGIANTNVTDTGLTKLHEFRKLKYLDLRFTRRSPTSYPNFTWKGVVQLKEHPSLKHVGYHSTFDKEDHDKIKISAPRFPTRHNAPVRPHDRKNRFSPGFSP